MGDNSLNPLFPLKNSVTFLSGIPVLQTKQDHLHYVLSRLKKLADSSVSIRTSDLQKLVPTFPSIDELPATTPSGPAVLPCFILPIATSTYTSEIFLLHILPHFLQPLSAPAELLIIKTIASAIIGSNLDYCNSLLVGRGMFALNLSAFNLFNHFSSNMPIDIYPHINNLSPSSIFDTTFPNKVKNSFLLPTPSRLKFRV